MSKLLAIVPAYNEEAAIASTVADIQAQVPGPRARWRDAVGRPAKLIPWR
jgi:glycosyltransferase involved in cell wall biosynthesis